MSLIVTSREVDLPVVAGITHTRFTAGGQTLMQPDGCWDFAIFTRFDGSRFVLRTGLTTRPDLVDYEAGDEILTISFRPSMHMSLMPGEIMRNVGVMLEGIGKDRFWLGTDVLEVPTLENADVFADRLIRSGIIEENPLVASVVDGHPMAMSERTLQRHFLKTTGLTYKHFTLVQRAQQAVTMLRMGRPAVDVAFALGFSDQAHMINSLKAIMGQTPREIARTAE
jgi:hypothetical protein